MNKLLNKLKKGKVLALLGTKTVKICGVSPSLLLLITTKTCDLIISFSDYYLIEMNYNK